MVIIASHYSSDPIDVIIGDWMSEANMTIRAASKTENVSLPAYEPTFLEALEPALPHLAKHHIRLAVNAGASDTQKLHEVVTKMVKSKGLELKIAWISGDEVMPAVQKAMEAKSSSFANVYTGENLADWKFKPLYAQAYLGGLGIAAAFSAGADIVICGRVSDASPIIGASVWWHSWERSQLERLANALVAGHLIECSSYVCGGNFTGFKSLKGRGYCDIGYPIAEISSQGQVVITKNKGSGGEISVGTCTSQLLYEIQGPWYFNSDVTADLSSISFTQLSTDCVALHGIKGLLPPLTTKVGITANGGYQAEMHWFLVGLDIQEKAAMLESQIRRLLAPYVSRFTVLAFTINGSSPDNPSNQNSATVDFRVLAQAPNIEDLAPTKFARPCLDNIMCTYPGATPHLDLRQAFPKPIYEYYVTLLPQSAIQHRVHIPWGTTTDPYSSASPNTIDIASPPATTRYPPQQPHFPSTLAPVVSTVKATGGLTDAAGAWAELPAIPGSNTLRTSFGPWGKTVRGPLGWLVHARSGDKGADANIGLWVRHDGAEYDWLRSLLSAGKMKELLGKEYKKGEAVERFEFAGLRAVHFLLRNHLDRGVSCTGSYDFLGKNCAEYVRARWVDLPLRFLERGKL